VTEERTCEDCKKLIGWYSALEHPATREIHHDCDFYNEKISPDTYAGECPHFEGRKDG